MLALVPLLLLQPAAAQPAKPTEAPAEHTVSLTTSLVTPFFSAYYLEGKLRATGKLALVLNASFLTLERDDWQTRTGTVGVGVDYFFQGHALRGWYVEGIGELWFSSWRHEPSNQRAPLVLGYAGVAVVGYQIVFDFGPVLDLGAGAVAFHTPPAHVELASGSVSSGALTQFYPAVKLDVGWAF